MIGNSLIDASTLVNFSKLDSGAEITGFTVVNDGNFVVTESDGGVYELFNGGSNVNPSYTGSPNYLGSIPGGSAQGVVSDPNGDLFIPTNVGGAYGKGGLVEVVPASNGTYSNPPSFIYSLDGSSSVNVAAFQADLNGNLFVATLDGGANNKGAIVELVNNNGAYSSAPVLLESTNSNPTALAVGPDGSLYITTANGNVYMVPNTGSSTMPIYGNADLLGPVNGTPTGMIVDAQNNIFLSVHEADGQNLLFEAVSAVTGYNAPVTIGVLPSSAVASSVEMQADAYGDIYGAVGSTLFEVPGTGYVSPFERYVGDFFQQVAGVAPSADEAHQLVQELVGGAPGWKVIADAVTNPEVLADAGPVAGMYQVVFGRLPDRAGFAYWEAQYANVLNAHGTSPDQAMVWLASQFVNSSEFVVRYGGANPSTDTFVTDLYTNVLGRAPDQAGLVYWEGSMNSMLAKGVSPLQTHATLVAQFVNSNEFVTSATPHLEGFLEQAALGTEPYTGTLLNHLTLAQVEAELTSTSQSGGTQATATTPNDVQVVGLSAANLQTAHFS